MAYWMLKTGRSSEEWKELSVADVKLMYTYYTSSLKRQYIMMKNAVMEGMSGGKKGKPPS